MLSGAAGEARLVAARPGAAWQAGFGLVWLGLLIPDPSPAGPAVQRRLGDQVPVAGRAQAGRERRPGAGQGRLVHQAGAEPVAAQGEPVVRRRGL